MKVSKNYIRKMQDNGFYVAKGLAVLNDIVAVTLALPHEHTRAMKLKTAKSVEAFNNDMNTEDWVIFREQKASEV